MSIELQEDYELLSRYLAERDAIDQPWVKNSISEDQAYDVVCLEYCLKSQYWPKNSAAGANSLWEHRLVIYRPRVIKASQALLFVNSGTRHLNQNSDNPLPQQLNFARMAAETGALVVDLQDVPNQYLSFEDKIPRSGDGLVAYTWERYLQDPLQNEYWPLYFPMAKAIIKAMDAVQNIAKIEYGENIEKFIVTGLSKRGLATWLAALSDDRIQAIVPIVIDILNTTENMAHIYASYNNQWPPAFQDFQAENLEAQLNNSSFVQLMNIQDPLRYIQNGNKIYKKRLSMPKYIISASGDDFFVPDSLNLYLKQLPGETQVRVVPNESHLISMSVVENALLSYYKMLTQQTARPVLSWQTHEGALCQVVVDQEPTTIKLWQAENPLHRDFRMVAGMRYQAQELQTQSREGKFYIDISVQAPKTGWKAHFVELSFADEKEEPFILTTSSYIIDSNSHS